MEAEHRPVIWKPHPGGQRLFLSCPFWEVLAEGNRGGGKTEMLLVDFLQHVGQGYGPHWRGILFRREYKHLDDVVVKARKLIPRIFPGARWLSSKSDYKWVFPDGAELLFRAFKDANEYWNYHGHEYPWIGWEELTNWPTEDCYESMKSCSRSSHPGMPRKYRGTTNPYGVGHGWVKRRFIDPAPRNVPIIERTVSGRELIRCAVNVRLEDNPSLLEAQPEYLDQLDAIGNEELRKAWRDGDWDIAVGGFLAGVWAPDRHKIRPFEIPKDWPRWRAMDWGYAAPYSVGWYTKDPDGVVYRYRELYGFGGKENTGTRESANEVAARIKKIEAQEIKAGCHFRRSPADTNIWHGDGREITIAQLFHNAGVHWIRAHKGPGSRESGAQVVIAQLKEDRFKVVDTCTHWLRTVPVMMPDPDNWDDVDTEQEDHAWDETRYSLVSRQRAAKRPEDDGRPKPGTFEHLIQVTTPRVRRSVYRL